MDAPKTLLVTGGSRGIGAAVALLAAERGHRVALSYRDDREAAAGVVAAVEASGGEALSVRADVADEADVLALYAAIDERFGRLDALVNNAGILGGRQTRFEGVSAERLERLFAVNVIGAMLCAREAVRRMSTRFGGAGGAIVNVSSMAARLGAPNEYVDYAASKGAIDTFTVGLAREVAADGVRVNGVRPGLIDTDIHASGGVPDRIAKLAHGVPMGRGGGADEVARSVLWLLSEEASYVTGALLDVSGGR